MNEKAASAQEKAQQERKRGQHAKAIKRLEQAMSAFPDEIELVLDAVDICLESGEVTRGTLFLKTAQDKFPKEKDRLTAYLRDKLASVHDPALARFAVENAIKLRDLQTALDHLDRIPDHTVRDLLSRTRTKKQTLSSASRGGHSLRGELLNNELMTALLSLRLGNVKEGVGALVQILDEKPVEQAILSPFLSWLETKHAKSGRVRFAHAVALCAEGRDAEGIAAFVDAARMEPPVAAPCADRLRILRETSKEAPKAGRALGEVLLVKGDADEASSVLQDYLKADNGTASELIGLLRPFVNPAEGANAVTWLLLDAFLAAEQVNGALDVLRPLQQRGNCARDLFDWFERHVNGDAHSVELSMLHANLAIDEKQYRRAAELLQGVCDSSPNDVPVVVGILDRNRTLDPAFDAMYRRYAGTTEQPGAEGGAPEGDFQMFDNREFQLPGGDTGASSDTPAVPASDGIDFASRMKKKMKKGSFVESREISFDDIDADDDDDSLAADGIQNPGDGISLKSKDDSVEKPTGPKSPAGPTPLPAMSLGGKPDAAHGGNGLPAMSLGADPAPAAKTKPAGTPAPEPKPEPKPEPGVAAPEPAAAAPQPAIEITEQHVANVAQQLYLSGAATFFHVDGDGADVTAMADAPVSPETGGTMMAPPAGPPNAEPSFDERLAMFTAGKLDNADAIAMMEEAVQAANTDALQKLLNLEPQDDSEDFSRRYYQAEYLLLRKRPLPAIRILSQMDTPQLGAQQKKKLWLKLAVTQRTVHNYTAANQTLTRLVDAFPTEEEFSRLARVNYEQYLSEQGRETVVLEKTSTLE
jgi:tetratricopeptide (TPR) repeat protein